MAAQQILSSAWIAVTALTIAILFPFVLTLIYIKATEILSRLVHRAVRTAVLSVQQTMPNDPEQDKLDAVYKIVEAYMDARHLNFPNDKIDAIIESEVFLLNHPELYKTLP